MTLYRLGDFFAGAWVSFFLNYIRFFVVSSVFRPLWASSFIQAIHGLHPSGQSSPVQIRSRRICLLDCINEPKKSRPMGWPAAALRASV